MITRILIPMDMRETNFAAKALAIAINEAENKQAELHVMTIVAGFHNPIVSSYFPALALQEAADEMTKHLNEYVKEKIPQGISVSTSVHEGKPAECIVSQAKTLGADMIVMPAHSRNKIDRVLLGSTTAKVVERAPCSVLVIRESS
ncbi:universal stress protein [Amphritea atlantica]|uniref:Universal stress protein n=1 Tax=Amphritea atlantica TaxID=355243 RepID=A0ABY5GSS2_9GAMM|nr:universal stress protein [Amphritea atlantica]